MTALSYLLFFGTLAISLWASWRVKAAYAKYSQVPASSGMTGAEVAAHETGHAIQHKMAYAPLNMRMAAANLAGYANSAVLFLPFLGAMTGLLRPMLLITCIAWGVIMLFNLITLPVEFDASNRAKKALTEMGFIRGPSEAAAVNQVLDAAALTYVAAFLTSLAYLIYYLLPLLSGGRRD